MQVADTLDDEEKEIADAEEAAENAEGEATTPAATETQAATTAALPSSSPAVVTPAPKPSASETPALRGTVKRVLMPFEKRNSDPAKNTMNQQTTPTKTPAQVSSEQRPRRAQPLQP
jgi:hypothetical protein